MKSFSLNCSLLICSFLLFYTIAFAADKLECKSDKSDVCIEMATAALKEGKVADGKKHLEVACAANNARGCLKLGIINEKTGQFDEAQRLYQKACDVSGQKDCPNVKAVEGKKKK